MCDGSCWPWGATCVSGTGWRAWTCGTASCGPLRWTVPAAGTTCPATRWCSPPDTPPATLSRCCWTPECPWPPSPSEAQFGPAWERLPAADYKLACHLPTGRSAFTFCVCPGGQVVAAASEEGRLVTNGMSCRARDGANINGGFLVGVSPADFGSEHPLAGVEFQRRWEAAAYTLGGGGFRAPAQTVADFLARRPSTALGRITPTYRPGVTPAELDRCLPGYVADTLRGALPLFDRKLRGFAAPEAVLTGVESRSSSPVRILRGEDFQSPIRGLYPCGEGAGYAGGITSAAVDGIRVAEAIASK